VHAELLKLGITVSQRTVSRRDMVWTDTHRTFVPPSPNLRSPQAALAYPGVCLLEATNLSEGRGTPEPFLLMGAPWLHAEALARAASTPGFDLHPVRFVPEASPAAPEPKHRGESCAGLLVRVRDPKLARPYELGVRLLCALRGEPDFQLREDGLALDRLVGTRQLRLALARGDDLTTILAADRAAIETWRQARKPALLY
jgi:uncharacterized protein YbbC (DUF1343 family)